MSPLLRAELLKLRTVRLPLWLLLTTLLLVVLSVLATVLTAGLDGAPFERGDPALLARAAASASGGNIVVLVLGILALTQEFRFGTATPSFLVTPRRGRVLAAKLLAIALVGLGFAAVSVLVALALSVLLIALRDGVLTWDRQVLEVVLGTAVVMVLYGPIGIAVGALVRNQIAAASGRWPGSSSPSSCWSRCCPPSVAGLPAGPAPGCSSSATWRPRAVTCCPCGAAPSCCWRTPSCCPGWRRCSPSGAT